MESEQSRQLLAREEAGAALKARRKEQGVTQAQLADYSGVSRVSLTKIERGATSASRRSSSSPSSLALR